MEESSDDAASNVREGGRLVGTARGGRPRDSLASLSSWSATRTNRTTTTTNNNNPNHHPMAKENNIISLLDVDTPPSKPVAATSLVGRTTQPSQSRPNNPFAQFALTSKNSFLEDTDDDDDNNGNIHEDEDDSHDEQVAIQLAIKKSLKDSKKIVLTKKTRTMKPKKTTTNKTTITLMTKKQQQQRQPPPPPLNPPTARSQGNKSRGLELDLDDEDEEPLATEELLNESSSSSCDEDDDDDDDAVDSHEQKVAMSVLETAASLSAQVLATMNQWATASTTTNTTNTNHPLRDLERESDPSHGLIVNGALALGSISTATLPSNSQWISEDTMQQACPGVTLSKYQLIGVNWLALLHGMKCTLHQQHQQQGHGKEDTPVNGVLADEMGLVRFQVAAGRFGMQGCIPWFGFLMPRTMTQPYGHSSRVSSNLAPFIRTVIVSTRARRYKPLPFWHGSSISIVINSQSPTTILRISLSFLSRSFPIGCGNLKPLLPT